MRPRVTLTLVLAAALLGGAYWYVEVKTKPAREAAKEDAKRVFPGEPAKASGEIVLRTIGKPDLILRQMDGAWNLIAPVQALADPEAVKSLIDELSSAAKDEVVEEKAADAHKYGLDLPSASVMFKPLSGKAGVLSFGVDSFDGRRVYGQVEGQTQVFLTELSVKTGLLKDANALRNKSLLVFDPEQVLSIRSNAKKGFSLEHDAQGQWQVREGAQVEPADAGRVMAWMAAIRNIKGDTVVEEKATASAKYGVGGSPRISVALKGKANLAILKGRLKDKGPAFYAQVQGQGQVWSLPASAAEALDKEAHALMDLRAFDVHAGSVERLVVWQPGLTLTAKRVDQKWAWDPPYAPKTGEAVFNLDEFVAKVGGAERLSRLPAKALPGKPLMTVTFYGPGDTVLDQALVGPKQGVGQLAQSNAKHLVMLVADNVFAGLPKPGKN